MTGFYFALKGDIGGIFPEAVLRTSSGHRDVAPCRIRSPGKRSATGEACRHAGRTTETQKAHPAGWALHLFDAWQFPTLTWGDPTLPSALRRFTSEFGMGSGGTTALVPPGKFFVLVLCLLRSYCVGCSRECQSHTYVCSFHRVVCRLVSAQNPSDSESELKIFSNPPKHLRRCKVKPHGSLVPVSSTHRCAYTPGLSTSSSSTFLQET